MSFVFPKSQTIPLGIVVRKSPGMTRWAKWVWRVVDILPGAGPADWTVLRDEAEVTEYHAATVPLSLYVSDTEAGPRARLSARNVYTRAIRLHRPEP